MAEYTGERLIPGKKGLELLELEHRARYELAARFAAGADVLDLGCGSGFGADRLASAAKRVVAIDVAAEAIEYARAAVSHDNVELLQGDVCDAEVAENLRAVAGAGFDLVTCFEVIEHLAAPVAALDLVREVLAPAGTLLISTPNSASPHHAVGYSNPFHVVELDRPAFEQLLGGRFRHVRLLSQRIRMVTEIGDDAVPAAGAGWTAWRDDAAPAKYLVAACSDVDFGERFAPLTVATDDTHLRLLHARLSRLRRDNHEAAAVAAELRARIDDLRKQLDDDTARHERLTTVLDERLEAAVARIEDLIAAAGRDKVEGT